jgi:hypothetical protein
MKTWVRKSLNVGVLSAAFLLVASGAAHADATTGNNAGAASGNQLDTGVQAPVNVAGNAVGLLGFGEAKASGSGGATATGGSAETMTNAGVGTGSQAVTNVQAPVNVTGNAIGLLGFAQAKGSNGGGATATANGASAEDRTTGNNAGAVTGNQLVTNLVAPVNVTGNAIGNATAGKGSGSSAGSSSTGSSEGATATGSATGSGTATGNNAGVASGNQASILVQVPVNACGNGIAVLGFADASCAGGSLASGAAAGGGSLTTGYNSGVAGGNQVTNLIQAPINACGNSVAVLGFASSNCGGAGGGYNNGGGSGNGGGGNGGGNNGGGAGGGYGAGAGMSQAVNATHGAVLGTHAKHAKHAKKAG